MPRSGLCSFRLHPLPSASWRSRERIAVLRCGANVERRNASSKLTDLIPKWFGLATNTHTTIVTAISLDTLRIPLLDLFIIHTHKSSPYIRINLTSLLHVHRMRIHEPVAVLRLGILESPPLVGTITHFYDRTIPNRVRVWFSSWGLITPPKLLSHFNAELWRVVRSIISLHFWLRKATCYKLRIGY